MKIKSIILGLAAAWSVGVSVSANATVFTSTDVPVAILDVNTVASTLNVGSHIFITDVNVLINSITHTFDNDLDIFLISPFGTQVELSTDNGGGNDNFTNTVFDDAAATSITAGAAPFTGSFRPEGLLSAFNGQDAFGTWTLRVTDDAGLDVGSLNSWGLDIEGRTTVPEPSSLAILGIGLAGLATMRRKQRA